VSDKYKIVGKIPIPVEDTLEWARWFENAHDERIVAQEYIGEYWVSTVFLGLDHSFGSGPPLLFETMIFHAERDEKGRKGPVDDAPMYRAPTWEMALEYHAEACAWAKEQMN
jgi:hypothetical protein